MTQRSVTLVHDKFILFCSSLCCSALCPSLTSTMLRDPPPFTPRAVECNLWVSQLRTYQLRQNPGAFILDETWTLWRTESTTSFMLRASKTSQSMTLISDIVSLCRDESDRNSDRNCITTRRHMTQTQSWHPRYPLPLSTLAALSNQITSSLISPFQVTIATTMSQSSRHISTLGPQTCE